MPGKIALPSGAWEMPSCTRRWAGMAARSSPSKRIDPALSGRTPEMVFNVVVLPAPLAPISVTISPSSTVRETPLIASTWP